MTRTLGLNCARGVEQKDVRTRRTVKKDKTRCHELVASPRFLQKANNRRRRVLLHSTITLVGLAFHILYTKIHRKGRTFFHKEGHGDKKIEDEDGRDSGIQTLF